MQYWNSSIRKEIKVLAVVLLAIAAATAYLNHAQWNDKAYLLSLPGNFQRTARSFSKTKLRPRVLIMGNSLVNNGIDPMAFTDTIKLAGGKEIKLAWATLIGSRCSEWHYILKDYFTGKNHRPDVIVLGFTSDFLLDSAPVPASSMPMFCDCRNLPELLKFDFKQLDDRVNLLLCFASSIFRYRQSYRNVILNGFIPQYAQNKNLLNPLIQHEKTKYEVGAPGNSFYGEPYFRLRRFLKTARATRARLIMVAMPVRATYNIDPVAVKIIEDAGCQFLDGRSIEQLKRSDFSDYLHLTKQGGVVFSRALSRKLVENFPDLFGNGTAPAKMVARHAF